MPYLLKTEPSTYSFDDLVRDGETTWDGISNPTALLNLRSMKPNEKLIIYHSNVAKAAVGTAKVVSVDASNPKDPKVRIQPGKPLKQQKTLANLLLVFSASIPNFLAIVVSHCLLLSAFVLFYPGVLHFFKSPRRIRSAWALTSVASVLTIYLNLSHDRTIALTYVIALSFFLVRAVIALEIFRQAADRIFLTIFAVLMTAYAIFALNRVYFLLVLGHPPSSQQRAVLQTVSVLLSVSFMFLIGLSFLLMLCSY